MQRPNILVLAGHDPSGGAGLQADIEAAAANGVHAASVCTVLTRQDTRNVEDVVPVDDDFFSACLATLAGDMAFTAIKTGVVASAGQVARIAAFAAARPALPLVVDPVLQAAGGGTLANDTVGQALRAELFGRARLITPNAGEARALCDGETDLDRCGARLAALGPHVLITGGDEEPDRDDRAVVNRLYRPDGSGERFAWPRLPGVFHGSGCTLASAIATGLGRGQTLEHALDGGQRYTARALEQAFAAGRGQKIPDRIGAGHISPNHINPGQA